MVPEGAVHIPFRGTAKICRRLEINYAEAVTGFEFGAQRAVPVVEGVVVAAENERIVIEAWQADEAQKTKKEEDKKEKAVLALWKKFFTGLRIMQRVRDEYGEDDTGVEESNPFTNKKKQGKRAPSPSNHEDTAMDDLQSMNARDDDISVLETPPEDEPESRFFPPALNEDEMVGGGGFLVENDQETRPLSPSPGPSQANQDEESHLPQRFAGVEVLDKHVTPARRSKGKGRLRNDDNTLEVAPIPTPRGGGQSTGHGDANTQDAQAQHSAPEPSYSDKNENTELEGESLGSAQRDIPRYEPRRRSQRVAARKG
jgi:xeroderma pigmentosum group C-complementing protein